MRLRVTNNRKKSGLGSSKTRDGNNVFGKLSAINCTVHLQIVQIYQYVMLECFELPAL